MASKRRPRVVNGPLEKPREPGRLGDLAWMTLLAVILALPAFLYAGLQAKLHEYRRDVVALEHNRDVLDEERDRLELEVALLSEPGRIKWLARDVNGLVPSEPEQVVYLPRTSDAPARNPLFVAGATGDANGRQRP